MADSEETDSRANGPSKSPVAAPEFDEHETSGAGQESEEISGGAPQGCEDDNTDHEQGVDL
eukprot:CAMPEP_0172200430 /NCGR_PEP_ID=MMETSP1050-20130122/29324_1 /TAXON_ID=233186 /ORGANISM="Cryptomonas curvata, Strain CCAP979/52" /LENGTH=60 /DNA_ID=CAMNT_0012877733 /DNA_START=20 /DNA_END=199 /DNA_ORIENTATION=+